MPDSQSLAGRIRALLAGGAMVLALGGGWYLVGPPQEEAPVIRVAAFNIQVFGKTKAAKPEVMDVLARVAREFDIVVVQEVRDASETVADRFLERINEEPGPRYAMYEGPRLGRTVSKEQYVAYYIPSRVDLLDAHVFADPDDIFEREPLVATFRAGNFDFTVVAIHIKPDDADAELAALTQVSTFFSSDLTATRPRTPTPALPFCYVTLRGQKPPNPAYPVTLRTIGDHIRKRRLDMGLLQREVAQQIGVTVFTIRNWERGRAEPAVRFRPGIVKFLGYDPLATTANTLGASIAAYRRSHGMSRNAFAAHVSVNTSTLWRWESNQSIPAGEKRLQLEALLACPTTG